MRFPSNLIRASFLKRLNRFAALMDVDGQQEMVHIANSGRLGELLTPENVMWLSPASNAANRKTRFDLLLVEIDGVLVSADARLPNALVHEAIQGSQLDEFEGYEYIKREVQLHDSRVDLALINGEDTCFIETKSVTLVEDGVAQFPDAPTTRGTRHVQTLEWAVRQGYGAAVVFIVQRPDANSLCPNRQSDPAFHAALQSAVSSGVECYAYTCEVSLQEITICHRIPVILKD